MKRFLLSLLRVTSGFMVLVLIAIGFFWTYKAVKHAFAGRADRLLEAADRRAWLNDWPGAAPLYKQAETLFLQQGEASKALYAHVSHAPNQSERISLSQQILEVEQDLELPAAKDSATRLRILEVLGYLEVDYDASAARQTYREVQDLATKRGRFLLASRALGEQGISAFLLGDTATARKDTLTAWTVAKLFNDKAAHIRYASLYAAGLVEIGRYKESIGAIDEAFRVYRAAPGTAFPGMAADAKIQALAGMGRYAEAKTVADDLLRRALASRRDGRIYQTFESEGILEEKFNRWPEAIANYLQALQYATRLGYWRGLTDGNRNLARAYQHQMQLQPALAAINQAIAANTQIPDELYYVPQNLALKAEILALMGQTAESNRLYKKSIELIDSLLATAPTPLAERLLISSVGDVYSGYFISLVHQGRSADAFAVIEKAHGRIESQSLEHHALAMPHPRTPAEQHLIDLNIRFIRSENPDVRATLNAAIYDAEQQLPSGSLAGITAEHPVSLSRLQADLDPSELLIEYVLASPRSYAIAVTRKTIHAYPLPPRAEIQNAAAQYRAEISSVKPRTASSAGPDLYRSLLAGIPEYASKQKVLVVPDGKLALLPYSALPENSGYVLNTHAISIVPSGTVLDILRRREPREFIKPDFDYMGVAAWTQERSFSRAVLRGLDGLSMSELVPLPGSKAEVEAIAADFPNPGTILLGSAATETHFKQLPLGRYNVLHLALHGYSDPDYPDRSALVFAPEQGGADDGLLQLREIRQLHLQASLVTLSSCDTGVGPVGAAGINDLGNAFIEAGSSSVVSALWSLEDQATKRLMVNFYGNLAHGEGKAEALRGAQLEMLREGSRPYYWASLELIGEPSRTITGIR